MIKNIIFDFGDIFINLDKPATFRELEKLGVSEISDDMMAVAHQYEKGLISTDEFTGYFSKQFNIPREKLVFAWNAILLDFPKERLAFLKELAHSKKYKLLLLSNTNDMHISHIQEKWGAELFNEFKNCFDVFYLSHEIHLKKPDIDIFEFVLKENNLIADETLFVDDLKENTDAANTLGIHTWNLIPGQEDVTELFTKNKI
ncbi:MAG: HAD family phosphatase [Polaribacter sp.]|uniref:HAD family hydrolase n=1 Tax=Polaribacter sp. TaxID=1920175 RepID=UPI0032661517